MADKTSIEWTDATWNPVRGCSRISPGCGGPGKQGGCYAEKIAARFSGPGDAFEGYAHYVNGEARWTGKMGLIADKLDEPLRWRKPRRVFVNSMSDLFHENLPEAAIDQVFAAMALCPQHTFQVLTKRAERMRDYIAARWPSDARIERRMSRMMPNKLIGRTPWPLPNVWLGVSVEDQERANERIPALLDTPAAKRFISVEPLLEALNLRPLRIKDVKHGIDRPASLYALDGSYQVPDCHSSEPHPRLDWVIVGGESGSGAREFNIQWAREIVAQCRGAGVACFVKQMGRYATDSALVTEGDAPAVGFKDKKGGDMAEWPVDLRVREFPA